MCLPQSTRPFKEGRSRSRPFCFLQVRIAEPSRPSGVSHRRAPWASRQNASAVSSQGLDLGTPGTFVPRRA
jgi:hypothetical protein